MYPEMMVVKAKMKGCKYWATGGLVSHNDRAYVVRIDEGIYANDRATTLIEIEPETVCRQTGLLDVDDNMIWEGDTVNIFGRRETVRYVEGAFCFVNSAREYQSIQNTDAWKHGTKIIKHAFDE